MGLTIEPVAARWAASMESRKPLRLSGCSAKPCALSHTYTHGDTCNCSEGTLKFLWQIFQWMRAIRVVTFQNRQSVTKEHMWSMSCSSNSMTNLEQDDGLGQIWVRLQRVLQHLLLGLRQHVLQSSTSSW